MQQSNVKQLDYVINKCTAAMNAGIPIIYIETDDMAILDKLLRSQLLVPYWYHKIDKDGIPIWEMCNSDNCSTSDIRPENINIVNGTITSGVLSNKIKNTISNDEHESFIVEHSNFKYTEAEVIGGVPMIIACRNYTNNRDNANALERLVSLHLSAMDDDNIMRCFIILQSPVVDLPSGIEPYVEVINVPSLKDFEIGNIITDFADNNKQKIPLQQLLDSMIVNLRGFTENKIKEILRRIYLECGSISNIKAESISMEIIKSEKGQMLKKSSVLIAKKLGEKEAYGLEIVKKWVSTRKKLFENSLDAKSNWAIDAPKGILISGIPGTGKSLLAEETARILGIPLIQMDMGRLINKYQGESEHNMRRAIHLAEDLAPCVLLIDEIEKTFAGAGGSNEDSGVTRRNFATFLTWMQEKESACFIFATANDISSLPSEFLRRGRFDQKFYTFMPDKKECMSIFHGIICGRDGKDKKLYDSEILEEDFLNEILNYCGEKGKFMTGADIKGIVDDAKLMIYLYSDNQNLNSNDKVLYHSAEFRNALIKSIDQARTYGETNMKDIVKYLLGLARNQFAPSSKNNIIDITKINVEEMTIEDTPSSFNGYDELLFAEIKETIDNMKQKKY